MSSSYILSIDQGTSSTKTIIFDSEGQVVCKASEPLKSYFFDGGLVEQNPEEIYRNVLISIEKCLDIFKSGGSRLQDIKVCGISNQRETFVVWDEKGVPLYNAIVWQCKRSVSICERLKKEGFEKTTKTKTGLIIDPYFSGSKLIWLYENVENVRKAIEDGKAYFGTIDTWLLYKFTNGKSYLTDYTNASRTMFFNIKTLEWDKDLLSYFGLSQINLPQPKPSSFYFGESTFDDLFSHPITIGSMIGDSHAAAFGEGCFMAGTAKVTLGTGCSILMNIGSENKESDFGIITTICWSTEERLDYALEGVIVSCGSTIEWLKNELGLFSKIEETEAMARSVLDNGGIYLIPAFSGLGAPHWLMDTKAMISGLTFASTKNHIVRAALESVAYQIVDVIEAMELDSGLALDEIMVNGGLVSNQFVLQLLANILGKQVISKKISDASCQGAAYLAGLKAGIYKDLSSVKEMNIERKVVYPEKERGRVLNNHAEWRSIVKTLVNNNKDQKPHLNGVILGK